MKETGKYKHNVPVKHWIFYHENGKIWAEGEYVKE
ncbi:MAG: hypothetical protein IPM74_11790 [Crocinitomicaceae bacterium]|nr:hypothetical protein [Crocinitomicaceae bacterium]